MGLGKEQRVAAEPVDLTSSQDLETVTRCVQLCEGAGAFEQETSCGCAGASVGTECPCGRWKVLGVDGGDGGTAMGMFSVPLSCTPSHG